MPARFLTPESELAALKARVDELSATVHRMYQTYYAATTRRKVTYGKQMTSMLKSIATVREHLPTMRRLVSLGKSLESGRFVVTLPKDKYERLMWMLRDKEKKEPGEI